jgi:hypothetical protein
MIQRSGAVSDSEKVWAKDFQKFDADSVTLRFHKRLQAELPNFYDSKADKSKLNDRDGHCSDRKSPDSETSSGVDSPRAHNMNAKATDLEQQNNACLFNTHISEPQS